MEYHSLDQEVRHIQLLVIVLVTCDRTILLLIISAMLMNN